MANQFGRLILYSDLRTCTYTPLLQEEHKWVLSAMRHNYFKIVLGGIEIDALATYMYVCMYV